MYCPCQFESTDLIDTLQRHLVIDPLIGVGRQPLLEAVQLCVEDHASRRLPLVDGI